MPRKSLRTLTTTYRRRQLRWDDAESCSVNQGNERKQNVSRVETVNVKKTRGRLVTPSPKAISTSGEVHKNKSKKNQATRGKRLFREKTAQKKRSGTALSRKRESVRSSLRKGSLKEKDPLKVVASKRKSIRYQKRRFSAGDSLATFLSLKPASKNSDDSTVISKLSKSNPPKRSERRRIDTPENNEKSKSICIPQTSSPPTTITTQEEDIGSDENEEIQPLNKKQRPIPTELISLLTASTKKRGRRRIRARSTLEILDEFKKNKMASESGKATRASLPRACKSSTKSILEEDSDGDSESGIEKNNDGDWTDDNTPTNDKKCSAVKNISPPKTRLRLRPRKGLSSSATNKAQRLLQLAPPPLINDDCESNQHGDGVSRKQRQRSNSLQDISAPRVEDGIGKSVADRDLSDEQASMNSRRKRRRRSIRYTNSDIKPSHMVNYDKTSPRKSSNSVALRRGSRQGRLKAYEDTPTRLVSLSNEASRTQESPTRTRQHLVSSPRRKKEQQLEKHQESEKEGSIAGKRVRFDSSTTTFSVKIKIKTNLDSSRQNRDGSEYGQSVPYSPSLDESAVQAIANQVTQACLNQARTSSGRSNSSVIRTCGDSVVNVDVDVNENENDESSNSSNSNQSSAAEAKSGDKKQDHEFLQDVPVGDARAEESSLLNKDIDDWRSVTSELTSDWNRPKPRAFHDHNDYFEKRRQQQVFPWGRKGSTRNDFTDHHQDESVSNAMKPPPAVPKSNRHGQMRSQTSMSRRQRIMSSGDSLAGSGFGSIVSAVEDNAIKKIPSEVSLRKPSPRSRNNISRKECGTGGASVTKTGNKEKSPGRSPRRKVESDRILPILPAPSRKSLGSGRCGNCKGCRRTFDCQTCDTCIGRWHSFGSASPKEGVNICLARRCQRASRIGFVDSLLGTDSSVNQLQSNEQKEAVNAKSSVRNETDTNFHDVQETASKTMKAPWEEGDDWTVDYSYLSEPEYRRHWGKNLQASSSTRSLSTPSRRAQAHRRQLNGGAGRTSLSSISESIVPQHKRSKMAPPLPLPNTSQPKGRGRRKGGKRKRDPLHGISLPRTSTDASSVTSWRENRKCLRALMEYDEADQDWV